MRKIDMMLLTSITVMFVVLVYSMYTKRIALFGIIELCIVVQLYIYWRITRRKGE
jgi:hypothetical protein